MSAVRVLFIGGAKDRDKEYIDTSDGLPDELGVVTSSGVDTYRYGKVEGPSGEIAMHLYILAGYTPGDVLEAMDKWAKQRKDAA